MKNYYGLKKLSVTAWLFMAMVAFIPNIHASQLDDATIFAIFDEVNTVDIWTARLAAQKGHSKKVRELGRKVASDHEAVQQMTRDLAKKLGIVPTPPPNDNTANDLAQTITMLQSKSGTEFDKAYLLHESKFHANAISAVKNTLLPALKNDEFKELILTVAPGFEHHLHMTTSLAKELGYNK